MKQNTRAARDPLIADCRPQLFTLIRRRAAADDSFIVAYTLFAVIPSRFMRR